MREDLADSLRGDAITAFASSRCARFQRLQKWAPSPHLRSNNMKRHLPEEFSTKLINRSPLVTMGNTVPPRDPDEDEEDEDDEEDDDNADEPPVVREPDED
jgi:hypothetical protein